MLPEPVVAKFYALLRVGGEDDCWPYEGGGEVAPGWHRRITHWVDGKKLGFSAHRVAYELANGEIQGGLFVLHRCDNPVCCNPKHLFLGTQGDNARDMWAKGRGNPGGTTGLNLGPSPFRKLTRESVAWAVAEYLQGRTQKQIAAELGITDVALGGCFRGKTYPEFADVVAPVQPLLGRGKYMQRN